ncbi:MAG TPA: hypothetical protein VFD58_21740 [Blastocatellia bacterium]|nr:hypothetical protein [Blastocatellia bacterium]
MPATILPRITAFVFLLAVVGLTSCGLGKEGVVVMIDESWSAKIVGTNRSGFAAPDGILWRQGKLYLADEGGGSVEAWSEAGGVRRLCDSTLGIMSPEDLVMDAGGNLFFTDDDAGGVWEVDAGGRAFLLAGKDKGLVSTEGIALAPSGDILVGDGEKHQVYSVSRDGSVTVFLGPEYRIKKPESMVFDERGNLYIADNQDNVVYLISPDRKLQRLIEKKEGFSPETIYYLKGTLYITDSQSGRLSRYTPEEGLKAIAVFGGALRNVQGVTADDQGNLYLSIQSDLKHKTGYLVRLERDRP